MKSCLKCKNYQADLNCKLWGSLERSDSPNDPGYLVCDSFDSEAKVNPLGIYHIYPRHVSP